MVSRKQTKKLIEQEMLKMIKTLEEKYNVKKKMTYSLTVIHHAPSGRIASPMNFINGRDLLPKFDVDINKPWQENLTNYLNNG